MATTFQEFIQMCVRKLRGEDEEEEFNVDYVSIAPVKWIVAYYYVYFCTGLKSTFHICAAGRKLQVENYHLPHM